MSHRLDRRDFLQTTAAISASAWLLQDELVTAAERKSPNEKLNIGLIGAGGKGEANRDGVASENIVALCDVDDNRAANSFRKYPKAARYRDFRQMLEKEKLDAVVVSTPDHTHAIAAISAMKLGLHVYCEKPLTWSVEEARLMTKVAREQKVATQMGNQGTAESGLRQAVEVIQAGTIGEVTEVHVWTNRPIWPQGMMERPKQMMSPPSSLSWDLFLGGAKETPYHSSYLPFSWRGWWDYGTGALGDMACHTANMAYMALKLGAPKSVEVVYSSGLSPVSPPKSSVLKYTFPARGEGYPAVTLFWYDGGKLPPADLVKGLNLPSSGSLLVGKKGMLYSPNDYGAQYKLLPEADFKEVKLPPQTIARSPGHYREWIEACKGGKPAMSNFDYAGPFTEFVLLGNVALRVGKTINWDAESLKAAGCPEADEFIRREYRKGWALPV
ncbi:Gfo/Idh/MocA family protein [Tuwongella immobilis]|uniref:Gfo/Idh/MocA-like oxidoreductase N-terminal domain-containing protein n=1 Tax=Tuwongella immobilis TaxID=692036 RepID=A0A6C2YPA4_9BACT|nr:Gfo/Idh/MocA family oxidoreductase [Tuwongella immobilis]VIP02963.1 oxidoreductase domain protein : Oxidoreductase domain protein OS=Planctomyces brasiliensis (strain ATCC 49424 / DSM 5305 / JCM 21570 / NBRC 103401 / IFAM 1448) GN=Plabr_3539 PE=4 SV=1: GFO_IDH_MocA: GFO_IDH_MocA_C [Tuwongella immobilis]VTS02977.1 oxidoreductase domain protein : Oxidoreductase domain protein OS=Planctomyces brasiliensis (strain ATCC 49424 / DSM 5305 / JCM 21570 / NBRC 103401 / IFAM 1448) GN=Plabr_3539 PE=4 SV=1